MFGERLKLARKKLGWSLDSLVESIGGIVTKQAISKYERNQMMPDSKVLIELSKALNVSIDYLFADRVVNLVGVDFRKAMRTSAKDQARVEANVVDHLERYLAIEEILELESARWRSPSLSSAALGSVEDAELLANELRHFWDLGENPIPDMSVLLEDYGLKVLMLDLPNTVSGMTCFAATSDGSSHPVIVVNENHSLERRRFTLAHELAHRVFEIDDQFPDQEEERAAQRFAGAFLMHADHLRKEVGSRRDKLGYKEIVYLKRMYRVSAAALVMRLEQIGIIARSTLSTIFQTIGRKWRTTEPDPIEEVGVDEGQFERPKRFNRLGLWALAEEYISPAKAMELLHVSAAEIRRAMVGPDESHC